MFVVHFYRIVFHPAFDPCTWPALLVGVSDFPLEGPVEFSPEEGQDILGVEAQDSVLKQFLIQRRGAIRENGGGNPSYCGVNSRIL